MASKLIPEARIRRLNDAAPGAGGEYVLYWMQASQRAEDNHALEYAVQRANDRGLPVVVGFGLTERYPGTNLRHKTFLLQGLQNVAAGLERRGICFVVRLGEPDDVAVELAATAALAQAREEAERIHGPLDKPPFIVPDNGPSFTAKRFVRYTRERFSHVRIAYRTPTQLGLLERLHRTLKREEVYWRLYDSPSEARQCQADFRERYDTRRPHWALVPEEGGDPLTPEDVYTRGMKGRLPAWQP